MNDIFHLPAGYFSGKLKNLKSAQQQVFQQEIFTDNVPSLSKYSILAKLSVQINYLISQYINLI